MCKHSGDRVYICSSRPIIVFAIRKTSIIVTVRVCVRHMPLLYALRGVFDEFDYGSSCWTSKCVFGDVQNSSKPVERQTAKPQHIWLWTECMGITYLAFIRISIALQHSVMLTVFLLPHVIHSPCVTNGAPLSDLKTAIKSTQFSPEYCPELAATDRRWVP